MTTTSINQQFSVLFFTSCIPLMVFESVVKHGPTLRINFENYLSNIPWKTKCKTHLSHQTCNIMFGITNLSIQICPRSLPLDEPTHAVYYKMQQYINCWIKWLYLNKHCAGTSTVTTLMTKFCRKKQRGDMLRQWPSVAAFKLLTPSTAKLKPAIKYNILKINSKISNL
jgi:hypothetical protein